MSVSHGVGGAWHTASAYWVGVGTTWRSVVARWVGVNGKWVVKFSTATVALVTAYVRGMSPAPGTATARWTIKNDGTILAEWTNQTFLDSLAGQPWLVPGAGAAGWEVRATKLSGNGVPTGDLLATWLNLGTTRYWQLATSTPDVVSSCVLTIEIRRVGDTTTRIDAPITLSVSVRTGGTPTYGTGVNFAAGSLNRPHVNVV